MMVSAAMDDFSQSFSTNIGSEGSEISTADS